jgi:hypothetical protein
MVIQPSLNCARVIPEGITPFLSGIVGLASAWKEKTKASISGSNRSAGVGCALARGCLLVTNSVSTRVLVSSKDSLRCGVNTMTTYGALSLSSAFIAKQDSQRETRGKTNNVSLLAEKRVTDVSS